MKSNAQSLQARSVALSNAVSIVGLLTAIGVLGVFVFNLGKDVGVQQERLAQLEKRVNEQSD